MKVTGGEELQCQMGHSNETDIILESRRELGAKAFHEYEGSGSGSGNDRKKERETTTGIYRNQRNIQFDHSAQSRLGKGESQEVWLS